ncbi:unnamed protein product [Cylicocyclus nassatus]|uniref:V-type proton ATPase subunit G n=1 Tax=Cylicocyclus nassatus TaxID=53992 RepID=A0AA36M2H5_CYLNA|nr:unnamed protein product [Cylicocyclus nassatus]
MSTSSLDDQAAQLNEVWEAEAKGRAKILEANGRRRKRIQEARLLAQSEIDRFKEEKEAAFKLKCQSFENEYKRRKRALIRDVERELNYMEARVQLCKPTVIELLEVLTTNVTYATHRNVETRQWLDTVPAQRGSPPVDRRQCDEATWNLIQKYAMECEKLASRIPSSSASERFWSQTSPRFE